MEFKDETEPLLNKEDNIIEIQDVFQKDHIGINKSKIQILNKSCSCSNIFENLFFCCIDYDLTNRQYELYLNLRNRLSIPYNQEDSNHEKLLKDFFSNLKDYFLKKWKMLMKILMIVIQLAQILIMNQVIIFYLKK